MKHALPVVVDTRPGEKEGYGTERRPLGVPLLRTVGRFPARGRRSMQSLKKRLMTAVFRAYRLAFPLGIGRCHTGSVQGGSLVSVRGALFSDDSHVAVLTLAGGRL